MKNRRGYVEDVEETEQGHKFLRFPELYFGKIFRLISVNVIYFITTLPLLSFVCLESNLMLISLYMGERTPVYSGALLFSTLFSTLPPWANYLFLALSAVLFGPLKMGVTYTYYSLSRARHAWLSELFTEAFRNARQGVFFGILDVFIIGNLLTFLAAASITLADNQNFALRIVLFFITGAFVFYMFVRRYFYLQAVTVELTVWQIIKNAFFLSVISLGRNFLACIAVAVVWIAALSVDFRISAVLVPLLVNSFAGFTSVYMAVPVLRKHLIEPSDQPRDD